MAKNKRRRLTATIVKRTPQSSGPKRAQSSSTAHFQPSQTAPTIPFHPSDHVLLVGEGDFSFSKSLVENHAGNFDTLLATTFDDRSSLLKKHPQAALHVNALLACDSLENCTNDDVLCDNNLTVENGEDSRRVSVAYSVDAAHLSRCKEIRRRKDGWDRIVFNFPHVGGKSTDVRRQVRHNQGKTPSPMHIEELSFVFFREEFPDET